jgi:hypothetical protein
MSNLRVNTSVYLAVMDIYESRRLVVQKLIAAKFDGKQAAFAAAIGRSPSYVSRMLTKEGQGKAMKRIDTKMAQHIEDKLDLPTGTVLSPVIDRAPSPSENAPPAKPAKGFKEPERDTGAQVLLDLEALLPEERATWVAELHRQAERAREIGRRAIASIVDKSQKVKPRTP